MNNKKIRNYGLWVAVLSLFVPEVVTALHTYNINLILPENYQTLVEYGLKALVLMGVISNPKEGKWFKDTEKVGAENE